MKQDMRKNFYRGCVLSGITRVLSEMDRDPFSVTYGSFDREYWAWATKDFSNIDLQRAVYPLTLVYLNDFEGNEWYQEPRIKDWILAGIRYCGKVQHEDGSFDHHYPNEHSFVGVAFPLYEISQAFIDLDKKDELSTNERECWLSVMINAANFIYRNNELHGFISNHRAGAACALYSMFLITGNVEYKNRAYFFIDTIVKKMSQREGWLFEYSGADPGYQTLDTYYLANFYRITGDKTILNRIIIPSIKFLIYFFHPDGSVGGEYGSRNCPLYFPGGFEILSSEIPEAKAIAQIGAQAAKLGYSPALMAHDLRNFVPMLSCYTQAFFVDNNDEHVSSAQLPFERKFERYWPEAGFFVRSDKNLYFILGLSKGGVIKVFDKTKKELIVSHAGYIVELENRKLYTTQTSNYTDTECFPDCISSEVPLKSYRTFSFEPSTFLFYPYRIMTPFRFFLFRLFNLTIGKIRFFNNWVRKNIIVGLFIDKRKEIPFKVKRSMTFFNDSLSFSDDFSSFANQPVKSIHSSDIFTTIYMGSSKYYRHSEKLRDDLSKGNFGDGLSNGKREYSYKIDINGLTKCFK